MDAVKLRPKEWLRLTESGTGGQLVTPMVVHILDDKGNSVMGICNRDALEANGGSYVRCRTLGYRSGEGSTALKRIAPASTFLTWSERPRGISHQPQGSM